MKNIHSLFAVVAFGVSLTSANAGDVGDLTKGEGKGLETTWYFNGPDLICHREVRDKRDKGEDRVMSVVAGTTMKADEHGDIHLDVLGTSSFEGFHKVVVGIWFAEASDLDKKEIVPSAAQWEFGIPHKTSTPMGGRLVPDPYFQSWVGLHWSEIQDGKYSARISCAYPG